ncbi:guanylate kinase [Periweissella fabalis]|uniref:Guanylate kinase n=1 Tax=Periweissella fabalis TaxID=1070421 RepID=A0A7X6N1C5_9LACO|nr:AAA family ATPase [Periweissella fabalis]MCM0599636.1 guanylate kinase [Periweissella fabalis]NKZ23941.1 guanylate kinase [Periweissella fabalis]
MQRKIFVITGPTGAGKTTISRYLEQGYNLKKVITHTTRPPRLGEIDGQDYYFETTTSFNSKHYLEKVEYAGNQYGSSREALALVWQGGNDGVIVLDTKGAQTYAQQLGTQAVIVYVTVSNSTILAQRLAQRGDCPDQIKQRLASQDFQRDLTIPALMEQKVKVILNDDLAVAKAQVDQLMLAQKLENI